MARTAPSETIAGVVVVEPDVHTDPRGDFRETYRASWFPGAPPMVQANLARRRAGVVVGLHHHLHQADLWSVAAGRARVVLHDLRRSSPTHGATLHLDLAADGPDARLVYVPPGVGHGFAALTDVVLTYLVDRTYDPADEWAVAWDDPEVAADWGVPSPVVSERDRSAPRRASLPPEGVPV